MIPMQRKVTPLKKIIVFCMLAVAAVAVFNACKKTDFNQPLLHERDFLERFFQTKGQVSDEVKNIIEKLKAENERIGFVTKLPANCGFPIWEKTTIHKWVIGDEAHTSNFNSPTHGPSANMYESEGDSTVVSVIPLTITNNDLSSILVVKEENGQTNIQCYTVNDYLYQLCHSTNVNIAEAERMLELFMVTEFKAFGTSKFYNIPLYIFANRHCDTMPNGKKSIEIFVPQTNPSTNLAQFECYYIPSGYCNCTGGSCQDWQTGCWYCSITYCINVGEETGGGGTGGGGTGGGGTGGGGTGGGGTGGGTGGGGTGGGGGGGTGGTTSGEEPCPSINEAPWYSSIVASTCGLLDNSSYPEGVCYIENNYAGPGVTPHTRDHVLKGQVKNGKGVGGHSQNALGVTVRWKPNTTPTSGPNNMKKGYIEVRTSTTSPWYPKTEETSMFPSNWSDTKIIDEITYAFNHRIKRFPNQPNNNHWEGTSSDGTITIRMYLSPNNEIITAFPVF